MRVQQTLSCSFYKMIRIAGPVNIPLANIAVTAGSLQLCQSILVGPLNPSSRRLAIVLQPLAHRGFADRSPAASAKTCPVFSKFSFLRSGVMVSYVRMGGIRL